MTCQAVEERSTNESLRAELLMAGQRGDSAAYAAFLGRTQEFLARQTPAKSDTPFSTSQIEVALRAIHRFRHTYRPGVSVDAWSRAIAIAALDRRPFLDGNTGRQLVDVLKGLIKTGPCLRRLGNWVLPSAANVARSNASPLHPGESQQLEESRRHPGR